MYKSSYFYPSETAKDTMAVYNKTEGQQERLAGTLYYHKLDPGQERKKGETVHDYCPSVWQMDHELIEWFRKQPFAIKFTIAPKWMNREDAKADVEYFMAAAKHFAETAIFPGYAVWESEMWIVYEERGVRKKEICRFLVHKNYSHFPTRP